MISAFLKKSTPANVNLEIQAKARYSELGDSRSLPHFVATFSL